MRYVKYGLGLLAFALLVFISWLTLTPAPQGVLVLEYHHVNDDVGNDGWAYTVPVADFAEQLDYLQAEGYTTITMQDFMRAKKGKQELPAKPVVLTFDDGYEDNYHYSFCFHFNITINIFFYYKKDMKKSSTLYKDGAFLI